MSDPLDVSRARVCFGFEAATLFDTGLRKTVVWYRRTTRNELAV